MVTVYGYSKCSTVKKSLKFLKSKNVEYTHIDNVEHQLTVQQLKVLYQQAHVDLKKFFNTAGQVYRAMNLASIYSDLTDEQRFTLLADDGMLVKRPILVTDKNVIVGFNEQSWGEVL